METNSILGVIHGYWKNMETTIVYLGLYRDDAKENGNYYHGLYRA